MEFSVGDFVRCVWGSNPREYEAKVCFGCVVLGH